MFDTLRRIEDHLIELRLEVAHVAREVDTLLQRQKRMANKLDDVITALNDNTNAVSARLDKLLAELAASGDAPTPEQIASLQAISDHLKALGADPSNPVPTPPVASVA